MSAVCVACHEDSVEWVIHEVLNDEEFVGHRACTNCDEGLCDEC